MIFEKNSRIAIWKVATAISVLVATIAGFVQIIAFFHHDHDRFSGDIDDFVIKRENRDFVDFLFNNTSKRVNLNLTIWQAGNPWEWRIEKFPCLDHLGMYTAALTRFHNRFIDDADFASLLLFDVYWRDNEKEFTKVSASNDCQHSLYQSGGTFSGARDFARPFSAIGYIFKNIDRIESAASFNTIGCGSPCRYTKVIGDFYITKRQTYDGGMMLTIFIITPS